MAAASTVAIIGGLSLLKARQEQSAAEISAAEADLSAKLLELDEEEALKIGDRRASDHAKKVRKFQGQQRASLAAQGISVDEGVGAELQREADEIGQFELSSIASNAWRQAFGLEQESATSRFQAKVDRLSGKQAVGTTLLTGGLQAATAVEDQRRFESIYGTGGVRAKGTN